jgi:putative restriction endonuclease
MGAITIVGPTSVLGVLNGLIGVEVQLLAAHAHEIATDEKARATVEAEETRVWEEHLLEEIKHDVDLPETERRSLVMARRGQGLFRERVARIEKRCRLTGVDRPGHLIASHAKPWRDSGHAERLDGENGLLLTPTVDHLFDRGFISFEDCGDLLISPVAHTESLSRMGVDVSRVVNVGSFSSGQKHFLDFHRANVFLARRVAKAG